MGVYRKGTAMNDDRRRIGTTDIEISSVAMGCWPIAGMTSLMVNDPDSVATLHSAVDSGINFFDTAYCYGANGESERLLARALGERRNEIVIATKGGVHWNENIENVIDGRPKTLLAECDESLQRLKTDRVELLYLHAPDPGVPLTDSAGALNELREAGKTRAVGVSNMSLEQVQDFHAVCPIDAVQPPYNMLQRQIEKKLLPWCREHSVSVMVYWPLMKGLLAGKLARDHVFLPNDGRAKYPMFKGEEWEKNQLFLDDLRDISAEAERTIAQVVINWTIHQPGITSALCGAKRSYQIEETAGAMGWRLSEHHLARINEALKQRGKPIVRTAL